ncbi:hypothetical protein EYF80_041789 [Liparis tanakae]|uniref:Uncharacterized protein n=1 Tax=Liparis tanakae TaxID=230148 RepID=A0A4Z2G382_9TELE|nr:hypothetical protein EYF80_041789 [Liparis tanakae]
MYVLVAGVRLTVRLRTRVKRGANRPPAEPLCSSRPSHTSPSAPTSSSDEETSRRLVTAPSGRPLAALWPPPAAPVCPALTCGFLNRAYFSVRSLNIRRFWLSRVQFSRFSTSERSEVSALPKGTEQGAGGAEAERRHRSSASHLASVALRRESFQHVTHSGVMPHLTAMLTQRIQGNALQTFHIITNQKDADRSS